MKKGGTIEIKNRKAKHLYTFITTYEAGIVLSGTEIKSIRDGKANLNDAYCIFRKGELFIKNMHISEYKYGSHYNHDPRRDRKLLLNKSELKKLERRVTEKGMTIIPYRLYLSERGMVKLEIALAGGKRSVDKSQAIKERDMKKDSDRQLKHFR